MPKTIVKKPLPRTATSHDVEIGTKIRERREALKMSQTVLGKHLGLSFQQIQKYEKGINRLSVGRLADLAAVLGVSISHFYRVEDDLKEVATSYSQLNALGRRAVRAYANISSLAVRRQIVRLAESLAGE